MVTNKQTNNSCFRERHRQQCPRSRCPCRTASNWDWENGTRASTRQHPDSRICIQRWWRWWRSITVGPYKRWGCCRIDHVTREGHSLIGWRAQPGNRPSELRWPRINTILTQVYRERDARSENPRTENREPRTKYKRTHTFIIQYLLDVDHCCLMQQCPFSVLQTIIGKEPWRRQNN